MISRDANSSIVGVTPSESLGFQGALLFSYGFTLALLLYRGQLGVAPSPTNVRMPLSTELLT